MKTRVARTVRPNAAISGSALSRLIWASASLILLWATIYWALS